MTDGDFWYATATRLLAPLLFAAAFGRLDMDDVVRWVATEEQSEVLDLLDAAGVPEAVDAARSTFGKEERQRSSIYTTVETVLEPFAGTDGGVAGGSSTGSVDPARLVDGPNTLYLSAPAHDQRRLTPLFVALLRQVVEHVYDRVARTGRPLDPPLLLVLDEAANIAPVGRPRRAGGHGRRSRRPAGDHLARPGPDHRPVRAPGRHRGQQPPGQALPVGDRRPGHPGPRQPAHR